MKISEQLRKYPISSYGNSKETEIYIKGFKMAIEIVELLEKEKNKEIKQVSAKLKEIEETEVIYPVLSSDDTILKRELKKRLYKLIETL